MTRAGDCRVNSQSPVSVVRTCRTEKQTTEAMGCLAFYNFAEHAYSFYFVCNLVSPHISCAVERRFSLAGAKPAQPDPD